MKYYHHGSFHSPVTSIYLFRMISSYLHIFHEILPLCVIPLTCDFQTLVPYDHKGNIWLPGYGSDLKLNKIESSNSKLF